MRAESIALPLSPKKGRGGGRPRARQRSLVPRIARLAAMLRPALLLLLAALCLAPIAVMLSVSLKTPADVQSPGFTFLVVPTLENYRQVL